MAIRAPKNIWQEELKISLEQADLPSSFIRNRWEWRNLLAERNGRIFVDNILPGIINSDFENSVSSPPASFSSRLRVFV